MYREARPMIHIVTVVNNYGLFESTIKQNAFMNAFPIHVYDNTRENIGLSKRYNEFLEQALPDDGWVVFCHQDFSLQEDLAPKLARVDPACLYGPTGTGPVKQLLFIASISRYGIERCRLGIYDRTKKFGRITQKTPLKEQRMGRYIRKPVVVDTVDCCCLIAHSSVIRKYGLRFDEKLDWHLYVEDFCLNARERHGVLTKALQLDCVHLSAGTTDTRFESDLVYLKAKYKTGYFSTTCYDGYRRF